MTSAAFQASAFQPRDYPSRRLDNLVNGVFSSNRVRVLGQRSAWNDGLSKRFDHLCSLQRGWDGYRGQPVSFACANFAAQVLERLYTDGLPPPSLVPGSDGTLQIEWHINHFDVELDILAPNKVVAYRYDTQTDEDIEIELDTDFTIVSEWLSAMKTTRRAIEAVG